MHPPVEGLRSHGLNKPQTVPPSAHHAEGLNNPKTAITTPNAHRSKGLNNPRP